MNSLSRGRLVVGGLLFYYPLPGVTWQTLHYLVGLKRLGWDVHYVEHADWHCFLNEASDDISGYIEWVTRVLQRFDLADRWHLHTLWDDKTYGLERETARRLLRKADGFLNVCGSQVLTDDHLACPRRLFIETDPVAVQIRLASGDDQTRRFLQSHTALFTFGENLGTPACSLPTGGFNWHPTRQPVLMDEWQGAPPPSPGAAYTTIGNWEAHGKDVVLDGRIYHWQKGREFLKVRDLPRRTKARFELAMNFDDPADRALMESCGWATRPASEVSTDVDVYRTFIRNSRAEFTAAKEQNVVFSSGWFSDRAVTYLAAGRPVINQDTGFGRNLPVGEGLFAYRTLEEAALAVEAIEADYARHSRAASALAREFFACERVLVPLLERAGLG